MKQILFYVGLGLIIVLFVYLITMQDLKEKDRAIQRCGGEDHIQEKYTKEGDVYYVCK